MLFREASISGDLGGVGVELGERGAQDVRVRVRGKVVQLLGKAGGRGDVIGVEAGDKLLVNGLHAGCGGGPGPLVVGQPDELRVGVRGGVLGDDLLQLRGQRPVGDDDGAVSGAGLVAQGRQAGAQLIRLDAVVNGHQDPQGCHGTVS